MSLNRWILPLAVRGNGANKYHAAVQHLVAHQSPLDKITFLIAGDFFISIGVLPVHYISVRQLSRAVSRLYTRDCAVNPAGCWIMSTSSSGGLTCHLSHQKPNYQYSLVIRLCYVAVADE